MFLHQVLDGSESQYSGMQIGTLQDEEDEGTATSSQEDPPEPFLRSALGMFQQRSGQVGPPLFPLVILISVAALSKPHLFEGRGHNRQGSDSSVDRFIPKDEPPEPEPDNKVQPVNIYLNVKKKTQIQSLYFTVLPAFVAVDVAD